VLLFSEILCYGSGYTLVQRDDIIEHLCGIRPADFGGFVTAQLAGGLAATLLFQWLLPGWMESDGG
jgi:hypothetical protein